MQAETVSQVNCETIRSIGHIGFFLLLVAALARGGGRAAAPAMVTFPEDDAPHSDMNTEWWYYHGHLNAAFDEHHAFHSAAPTRKAIPNCSVGPL